MTGRTGVEGMPLVTGRWILKNSGAGRATPTHATAYPARWKLHPSSVSGSSLAEGIPICQVCFGSPDGSVLSTFKGLTGQTLPENLRGWVTFGQLWLVSDPLVFGTLSQCLKIFPIPCSTPLFCIETEAKRGQGLDLGHTAHQSLKFSHTLCLLFHCHI